MALLSTSIADASTLRLYIPGGSPCDGVCSYEWAVQEFGVPEGEPVRMVAPEGSIVTKMSYGRDGQPYAMSDSAILATDQYGEGYWFEEDGRRKLMFRLDECQNWSVLEPPLPPALAYPTPAPPETFYGPPIVPVTWSVPPVVPWFTTPPGDTPCCVIPPTETPPTETPVVPLPMPILLLLSALGMLFFLRRQI